MNLGLGSPSLGPRWLDERGRLVRVVELVPCTSPSSRIAALVKVRPEFVLSR